MVLRLRSHLAPSLPHALFEAIAAYLGECLGAGVALSFDESRSGPVPGADDPFATGEVDLAFVCASSYVWLRTAGSPVVLAGAAWVPTDPRAGGEPHYFADILVRADDQARGAWPGIGGLAGRRVAFNDRASLSGFQCLRLALADHGHTPDAVDFVETGSHLRSIAMLRAGAVDAAAIDANVWRRCRRDDPVLGDALAAVDALGPLPAQPLIAHNRVPAALLGAIRAHLLDARGDVRVAAALADAELARFSPVDAASYAVLARQLGIDASEPRAR
jgi:phosphonate transport system substrate-binding protein